MKKILLLILLALLLLGCSPQKRLQRLVKHNPELITTDTIRDTTIVPGWQYDTIAKLGETDTVVVTKEGTTVTIYKWNTDSIFVDVLSEPDTIYKDIPCPQYNLQSKDEWYITYWWLILIIFVAILFILNKLFK